jgi:hypothetical protein
VLERLKKLFSPRRDGPEVEYERVTPKEQPSSTFAGPPVSGIPPAAPLEPPAPEEPDPRT